MHKGLETHNDSIKILILFLCTSIRQHRDTEITISTIPCNNKFVILKIFIFAVSKLIVLAIPIFHCLYKDRANIITYN